MEKEEEVIDEATPTTIERGYGRNPTLPAGASTTTVVATFYFAHVVTMREVKPESKVRGSTASLAPEYREHVDTGPSDAIADLGVLDHEPSLPHRRSRNAAAIALLDRWLADDSGYDEQTWPALKKAIEESRTSKRKRFRD